MEFKVAVLDCGSQFTQLVVRRIRERGAMVEILPWQSTSSDVRIIEAKAIIISGGPLSVGEDAPSNLCEIIEKASVPVLGICYGNQLICRLYGSKVELGHNREFGAAKIEIKSQSPLIEGIWQPEDVAEIWMSHSDTVLHPPIGFTVVATSFGGQNVAIVANEERHIYGIQFHPEVTHSGKANKIFDNFLKIAGYRDRSAELGSFLEQQMTKIRETIGSAGVIAAVSGGVDSTVAATIVHLAVKDQLKCVFIDTGLLRLGELENAKQVLRHLPVKFVDGSRLFLERLDGVNDPEEKRKIIGKTFIDLLEQEAQGASFLVQGTVCSDVIESTKGLGKQNIKSHHNVGGLPERMNLKLIEPLRELFKDEVRNIGLEMGIEREALWRHPFPGPGLAVRIMGEISEESLEILRAADDIFIKLLRDHDLYRHIWQAFAILLPTKTVGVIGDYRTYGQVCALRAVVSVDGMTASAFPHGESEEIKLQFWRVLEEVSTTITNRVSQISRVVYDITSKPPATIEWE